MLLTGASIGLPWPAFGPVDPFAAAKRALQTAGRRVSDLVKWIALLSGAASQNRSSAGRDAALAREFERLVLPHLDAAYTLARYLSGNADASDDIVQEAYLKAFDGFGGFRGGDARAWILAIVRNGVRDWRSRQGLHRRRFVAIEGAAEEDEDLPAAAITAIAEDIVSAEAGLLRSEEDGLIRAIVDRLPESLREVLLLREIEDLSYRQIAEATGIPMGTVMSRLARARDAFAKLWLRVADGRTSLGERGA